MQFPKKMKTQNKYSKYGFKVLNEDEVGFYRWFSGNTVKITDNKEGKLPLNLNRIYTTQCFLGFYPAYKISENMAEKYRLQFIQLTKQDWKNKKSRSGIFLKRY